MRRSVCVPLFALLAAPAVGQSSLPKTTAESTGYRETTRHADVVTFGVELAKRFPAVTATTYGVSHDKLPLPLLILSDPPVSSPADAAKSGKPVVFAFANIHAGEVDGKEALLMLARDLAAAKSQLLKDVVLILAPDINPDGNEKIDAKNRTEQNGPPAGVGTRANAQGFDLNRDFVKLESPEIRHLVKVVNDWNPVLVIDCHTTNGSYHRYTLTYDGPRYPAAAAELISATQDTMLPAVAKKMKAACGFDTFVYGNFNADNTEWETYPATPRFGVQYFAVRGQVGLLSESYSYAPFADRVKASYHFVQEATAYAAANPKVIAKVAADAGKTRSRVVLRTKTGPADAEAVVFGYAEVMKDGKRVRTETPKDYPVKVVTKVIPTVEVDVPAAYLIPPGQVAAVELLRRHGVEVRELREDVTLDAAAYTVREMRKADRAFQKHNVVTLEVERKAGERMIPAGTAVVATAQKLGMLAAYLLEPQAEDGFAAWNVFDASLAVGKEYPVLRAAKVPTALTGDFGPLPDDKPVAKPITHENLTRAMALARPAGGRYDWLPDGEHYTQPDGGGLKKVHARTGKSEPFTDGVEGLKKSLAGLPGAPKSLPARPEKGKLGVTFAMGADLGFAYFDGTPAVKLTKSGGGREFPDMSADAKYLAFVRNGNVYTVDVATQTEKQKTADGGDVIVNGRGDWVYEEEIFNRNGKAYWWSPDAAKLVFMRFDDTPVKKFTVMKSFPARGEAETYGYPKSGDPNPTVKLGVVGHDDDKPTFLDMGDYKPAAIVISRVGWVPGKNAVFAQVQNREQTWLDFVVWDTVDAKPRVLFRDTTKAWVEDLGEPHWLPGSELLFASERTGWKHLYRYSFEGKLLGAVTTGEWEVRDVSRVDATAGTVYFTGTKDGHNRLNLYRAKLDGSGVTLLTNPKETHAVTVAPAGDLFIDRASDDDTPVHASVRDGAEFSRNLDTNPARDRAEYQFGKYERASITTPDGFVIEAGITKPAAFDPAKMYPVWVQTYAGPHAPVVKDGWGTPRIRDQAMANMGMIVMNVDPRSASGKGAVSTWACYRKFGVQELKDLEAAVAWVCQNPWADATRVGLSGHSYGGYMTAFALTHSKVFAAGIAGAPVTDWHLYDSIYTERYMGLPADNKDGYDASSVVKAAKNLNGKLLLIHGLIDDNVHFQNSAQFVDALQQANKTFDIMVYPRARHGIGGPHYQKLQLDFIRRTMKLE